MRTSLPRFVTYLTVALAVSAFSVTGCQTSSSFKMPKAKTNWLSWWKKKPASSTLSSTTPSTQLPAPPSATATPTGVPSYAQAPSTTPARSGQKWGSTVAPASQSTQPSYAAGQPSAGQYSNASWNTNPASGYSPNYPAPTTNPGYASSGASPSRGFYSPNYNSTTGPATSIASQNTAPSAYSGTYSGTGYQARTPYGASSTPNPSSASLTWAANAQNASQQTKLTNQPYRSSSAQAQPLGSQPAYSYNRQNAAGSSRNQPQDATSFSLSSGNQTPQQHHSADSNSQYSWNQTPRRAATAQAASPASVTANGYRPGSTSRSTPFGDSRRINVAGVRGVQQAAFGYAADANAATAAADGNAGQPAGGAYSTGEPTRTATGTYPHTDPSTYR